MSAVRIQGREATPGLAINEGFAETRAQRQSRSVACSGLFIVPAGLRQCLSRGGERELSGAIQILPPRRWFKIRYLSRERQNIWRNGRAVQWLNRSTARHQR